jgi:hypothetical protein
MSRKPRVDRAYLIYKITCTTNLECYIGLVVRVGQATQMTLRRRLRQHIERALSLGRAWELHEAIRKHGADVFTIEHLETVRGRAAAHVREVELMVEHRVTLNTRLRRM